MKVVSVESSYREEKLKAPFGFKGGYISSLWIVTCKIRTERAEGVGEGVQSVLWSDSDVFITFGPDRGNEIMYEITKQALSLLVGKEGETPIELIEKIEDDLFDYAKNISGKGNSLRETFVKNALVAVDNALWQAYAKQLKSEDFMEVIPNKYRAPLCVTHKKLCNIPLITYGLDSQQIKDLLDVGSVLLKIKIGNNAGGKLSQEEMLSWDKERIWEVHEIAKNYTTKYTKSQKILYYLDANGQYDSVSTVLRLCEYLREIDAFDRVVLLEEPFDESNKSSVKDIPLRVASDESVHSEKDVDERISLGYSAIALKPIAKTLSETLKILKKAYEKNVVCFCADLTVTPKMVEWNKNVASRIMTLPEMEIGILESNGEQNYVNWEEMKSDSPLYNALGLGCKEGLYTLSEEFFKRSGGIFI